MEERRSIILADDNTTNLIAGKTILKGRYTTYPVPSAALMFELLENITPDLILLDIEMPEMDGYEAIKKLKANPKWQGIPVMFVTGRDSDEDKEKGLELGAVDYVIKPFSPTGMFDRIESFFNAQK